MLLAVVIAMLIAMAIDLHTIWLLVDCRLVLMHNFLGDVHVARFICSIIMLFLGAWLLNLC